MAGRLLHSPSHLTLHQTTRAAMREGRTSKDTAMNAETLSIYAAKAWTYARANTVALLIGVAIGHWLL